MKNCRIWEGVAPRLRHVSTFRPHAIISIPGNISARLASKDCTSALDVGTRGCAMLTVLTAWLSSKIPRPVSVDVSEIELLSSWWCKTRVAAAPFSLKEPLIPESLIADGNSCSRDENSQEASLNYRLAYLCMCKWLCDLNLLPVTGRTRPACEGQPQRQSTGAQSE